MNGALFEAEGGLRHAGRAAAPAILFIEDFDEDAPAAGARPPDTSPPPPPPITEADLASARATAWEEGWREARREAAEDASARTALACTLLAERLAEARGAVLQSGERVAAALAELVLAALSAALPATMRAHALGEAESLLGALLPSFRYVPDVTVRVHPDLAEPLRSALRQAGEDPAIAGDPTLVPGDVVVAWPDGQAARDSRAIWTAIRASLAPLGLPPLEDLLHRVDP